MAVALGSSCKAQFSGPISSKDATYIDGLFATFSIFAINAGIKTVMVGNFQNLTFYLS